MPDTRSGKKEENKSVCDMATLNAKVDKILSMHTENDKKLSDILSRLSDIDNKLNENKKDISQLQASLGFQEKEIENFKVTVQNVVGREEFHVVDAKLDDLENRSKRNNLIFWNLPEDSEAEAGTCEEFIEAFISKHMEVSGVEEDVVERAHRSGKKTEGKNRPIHVKFLNWRHKEKVLKSAAKALKNNPFNSSKIFISDDITKKTRDEREILRKSHLKNIKEDETVEFAFIPWGVPARITLKMKNGQFKTIIPLTK